MQSAIEEHTSPGRACWFALHTRSRYEKNASMTLERLGVTHFLPMILEQRRWSDRNKTVGVPLFPGYLFVRTASTPELMVNIRKVTGVIDFVGNHNGPAAVPDDEIESIRALLSRGRGCSAHFSLASGDRVRIVRGVLKGIEGTLLRCGAKSRVFVCVQVIQRAVSVEVADSDVEPIPNSGTPQPESPSVTPHPKASWNESEAEGV